MHVYFSHAGQDYLDEKPSTFFAPSEFPFFRFTAAPCAWLRVLTSMVAVSESQLRFTAAPGAWLTIDLDMMAGTLQAG